MEEENKNEELTEETIVTEETAEETGTEEAKVDITSGEPVSVDITEGEKIEVLLDKPAQNKAVNRPSKQSDGRAVKIVMLTIGIVALVLAICLAIFVLPAKKRSGLYYNSAAKKYAAGDYKTALTRYEKAFELDNSRLSALTGAILSAAADGEIDYAMSDARSALWVLTTADLSISEDIKADAMELFLHAYEQLGECSTDGENTVNDFAAAFEALNSPGELAASMADVYYNYAETLEYTGDEGVTKLEYLEKAADLSDGAQYITEYADEALSSKVYELVAADDYEGAFSMTEKYAALFGSDRETLDTYILDAQTLYETKVRLLTQVYDNMSYVYTNCKDSFSKTAFADSENMELGLFNYDWIGMIELDGSADADTLSLAARSTVWAPGGITSDFTGVACGLYSYGDTYVYDDGSLHTSYYFYFGEYKDGVRSGYGITFVKTGATSFYAFEGEYSDDEPNGFGILYKKNTYAYTALAEYSEISFGEYVKGLQNGTFDLRVSVNEQPDTIFEGTYEVNNGVPTEVPMATSDYEILNGIPEGYVLIGVIPSTTDGYSNYMIYRNPENSLKASIGY